jgi:hypothetical protein
MQENRLDQVLRGQHFPGKHETKKEERCHNDAEEMAAVFHILKVFEVHDALVRTQLHADFV